MSDYKFDAEKAVENGVQYIKDWFETNANGYNAVVEISENADSFIVANLCVMALGKDKVIGVLMPNWNYDDTDNCYALCEQLDIRYITCSVECAVDDVINSVKIGMASDNFNFNIANKTIEDVTAYVRSSILHTVSENNHGVIITHNLPINTNTVSLNTLTSYESIEICKHLGLI